MAMIQTVLGPIRPADLGFTLAHEHVTGTPGQDNIYFPWRYDRERTLEWAVERMTALKAGGVDSFMDLTTHDLGQDIEFMVDASRASGVHVIPTTGFWCDPPRSTMDRDADATADIFVREIEYGIGRTNVRAGMIKVGSDREDGMTPLQERVWRAAARACKRTGTPINTHCSRPEHGADQLRIFMEEGAPMDRISIGHVGDTTDVSYLESLLRAGVYLTMDRYSAGRNPTWEQRNTTVKALIDRGWGNKIMLGHDAGMAGWVWAGRDIPRNGGLARSNPHGALFLSKVALPALLKDGVSQDAIDVMMRETPRRFLSGEN